jgi:transcriptional regulator with XRE-family HTH domain
MQQSILPDILKQLRDEKRMSLDDLSKKSKVDKSTIHRIEQGKQRYQRQSTIDKLSRALNVEAGVLIEKTARPPSTAEHDPTSSGKQQLNVRVDSSARNALALVAKRYNVSAPHIIEAAPLLFLLVAERSLQQRREKLDQLKAIIGEVEASDVNFPHVPESAFCRGYEAVDYEDQSIKTRDLFGEVVDEAPIHDGSESYENFEQNPFALFVKEEAQKVSQDIEIFGWSSYSGPDYAICADEALAIVGGDEKAADDILCGRAPLNELPKELRGTNADLVKRAEWAKEKAKEQMLKLHDLFPELAKLEPKQ